jgi:hypothetical protein
MQPLTLEEQERAAYMNGDTKTAALLGELEDVTRAYEALEEKHEDTEVFTDELRDELEALREFFSDCFERLAGHYPAPSVFSDYDKNVIFETIEAGAEK